MPIDEHLAFDTTSVELRLHWLTLRYGIEVRLLIADLRSRYGDQKGDRIRLSRYISSDAQAIDTLRHEYAHAVAELKHRSKAGHGRLWRRLATGMGARPRSRGPGPRRAQFQLLHPHLLPAKAQTLRNPLTPRFRIVSQNIRATLKRRGAYHAGIVCAARRARACRGVWRGGLRRQRRGEIEHDRSGLPRAGRLLFPADKPNRRGRQAAPGFPQKRREDLPHFHNRLVEHRPGPQAG